MWQRNYHLATTSLPFSKYKDDQIQRITQSWHCFEFQKEMNKIRWHINGFCHAFGHVVAASSLAAIYLPGSRNVTETNCERIEQYKKETTSRDCVIYNLGFVNIVLSYVKESINRYFGLEMWDFIFVLIIIRQHFYCKVNFNNQCCKDTHQHFLYNFNLKLIECMSKNFFFCKMFFTSIYLVYTLS